ncbi:hypothetical protein PUNSTDRAFT_139707 [Punctularia strigosozonata HHB-11173 SS5]|uniref:Uncharacterized protein n=1 Tax=Punctularia strigosozonata (strain HHB-11173) TaxID=741275 RepID=R7S0B4_PUNST|nr:uncharacterized protein PUNSTDRAFT_139707 [Punctularia strigosozonata HHB-11173 SS5]EIN03269.1 hypothetical protein PUNSTDRAFT_139707 [Punctularia strigosozonata HHB-11173 SS5]
MEAAQDSLPVLNYFTAIEQAQNLIVEIDLLQYLPLVFRPPNDTEKLILGHSVLTWPNGPDPTGLLHLGTQLLDYALDAVGVPSSFLPPPYNSHLIPISPRDNDVFYVWATLLDINSPLIWQLEGPIVGRMRIGVHLQMHDNGWVIYGQVTGIMGIERDCMSFWITGNVHHTSDRLVNGDLKTIVIRVCPQWTLLSIRQWARYRLSQPLDRLLRARKLLPSCRLDPH